MPGLYIPGQNLRSDSDSDRVEEGANASQKRSNTEQPLAKRGAEWGLPNRSAGATGITRPIRIDCSADQLVIHSERGHSAQERPDVLSIDGTLNDEVDQLVSKIWQRMEGWGMAGAGMYWKPVLTVNVRPGGEQRYGELVRRLEGSGIIVKRKTRS
jgi:hypothetical protein